MPSDFVETVTGTVTSYVSLPLLIVALVVTTILFVVAASYFLIFDIFGFVALLLTLFLVFLLIIRTAKVRTSLVLLLVASIIALMIMSIVLDHLGAHLWPIDFYYSPFEEMHGLLVGGS